MLNGIPRAQALRQSQLAMKKNYPDPYCWGAFICKGNPDALIKSDIHFLMNDDTPHSITALLDRAIFFDSLGSYEESVGCYDKVIEIDHNNVDAWNGKIGSLNKLGRTEEANKLFREFIKSIPDRGLGK